MPTRGVASDSSARHFCSRVLCQLPFNMNSRVIIQIWSTTTTTSLEEVRIINSTSRNLHSSMKIRDTYGDYWLENCFSMIEFSSIPMVQPCKVMQSETISQSTDPERPGPVAREAARSSHDSPCWKSKKNNDPCMKRLCLMDKKKPFRHCKTRTHTHTHKKKKNLKFQIAIQEYCMP
jgi:hypothetical protein